MGERAIIQLHNKDTYSPTLYLHWAGESVGTILAEAQERMKGRPDDVEYAFARLAQIAMADDDGNTSFGIVNHVGPVKAKESPGDAGIFLVDVTTEKWTIQHADGYGLGDETIFKVKPL